MTKIQVDSNGKAIMLNNKALVANESGSGANTDLSNLSATGRAVIDGQWVNSVQAAISSATTINASTTVEYTFTNLPEEDCEVILTISQSTDCEIAIFSNLITSSVNRVLKKGCANTLLPVASDKVVKIRNYSTTSATISIFRSIAYRRIGTNS